MIGIVKLRNPVQPYAWGSRTVIARLLGKEQPSAQPQAEMWMGAHPAAPSEVELGGRWVTLDTAIREAPVEILGPRVVERYGENLPFLLKVLAAERPLSLQAHPDRRQAVAGFRRESASGLALGAVERSYRDPNPKPEILCALGPFWLLAGFRPPTETATLVAAVGLQELLPESTELERPGGLRRFFVACLSLTGERAATVLQTALARARQRARGRDAFGWVVELAKHHPDDPGILAPLFLNLGKLQAGQAIFNPPGVLHAYLEGTGVELMANSDNVLRAGLTEKRVDLLGLVEILRFDTGPLARMTPRHFPGEARFLTPAAEFALSILQVSPGAGNEPAASESVEILLCTRGTGTITARGSAAGLAFTQGEALLVPAAVGGYRLTGEATLFRARVAA